MQIEPRPLPLTPVAATVNATAAEASGFQAVLARVQERPADTPRPPAAEGETPPLYLPVNPPLDKNAGEIRLQKTLLDEEQQAEISARDAEEELALELEGRDEELGTRSEELLWEELPSPEDLAGQEQEHSGPEPEPAAELQESADGGEGEIVSDHESLILPETHEQGHEAGGSRTGWAFAAGSPESAERDLNYEEIQHLVNTILNSEQKLPHQVRHILQDLLNGMLDGQRQLLDQHRLVGLEPEEYSLLLNLFPPHFYAGWLRQERQRGQPLPLYPMIQDLFTQQPPDARRKDELLQLLSYSFDPLPLPLRNWVLDQPPLLEDRELINLLEIWQQQQALPPGAIGQLLHLAQTYQHHPETMRTLFSLSQTCLHRRPLAAEQIDLLAIKLYERCFPPLADESQTLSVLKQVLQGKEPGHEALMRLLLGSAQAVLSYLPYAYLHPALQEIQDYVRRDLFGQEDQLPELFRDEAAAKMA